MRTLMTFTLSLLAWRACRPKQSNRFANIDDFYAFSVSLAGLPAEAKKPLCEGGCKYKAIFRKGKAPQKKICPLKQADLNLLFPTILFSCR
ncbi:hypothetical protein [Croceiramulus getboli]|nr:hypothetical protein P8624_09745 [Flavobacteriaceae bacterium YJPT1-3]